MADRLAELDLALSQCKAEHAAALAAEKADYFDNVLYAGNTVTEWQKLNKVIRVSYVRRLQAYAALCTARAELAAEKLSISLLPQAGD